MQLLAKCNLIKRIWVAEEKIVVFYVVYILVYVHDGPQHSNCFLMLRAWILRRAPHGITGICWGSTWGKFLSGNYFPSFFRGTNLFPPETYVIGHLATTAYCSWGTIRWPAGVGKNMDPWPGFFDRPWIPSKRQKELRPSLPLHMIKRL